MAEQKDKRNTTPNGIDLSHYVIFLLKKKKSLVIFKITCNLIENMDYGE